MTLLRALMNQAARRILADACACAGRGWSVSVSRDLGVAFFRAEMGSGSFRMDRSGAC